MRGPVEQFATWHHLRRLRQDLGSRDKALTPQRVTPNKTSPRRSSFLPGCTTPISAPLATCLQQDVDEWLVSGPTTQIRRSETCFAWAKKSPVEQISADHLPAEHLPAAHSPRNSGWHGFKELLDRRLRFTGLPRCRNPSAACIAQPLTKIAALQTSAVTFAERRRCGFRWARNPSRYRSRSLTC